MPIPTLDSNSALIVIDMQKGIVGRPTAHPIAEISSNVGKLAKAFRERDGLSCS